MKNIVAALFAAALVSAGASAQENPGKPENSADVKVGGPAPPDAARATSEKGRPRAGIEYGTASATEGGRTDTGAPVADTPSQRNPGEARDSSDQSGSTNRNRREGVTEDRDFNRIPERGATMMTPKEQKQQGAAARRRGKQRDNSVDRRSSEQTAPDPETASVPRKSERQQ